MGEAKGIAAKNRVLTVPEIDQKKGEDSSKVRVGDKNEAADAADAAAWADEESRGWVGG